MSFRFQPGTYDLFLTHAWHYTDEWQQLVAILDRHLGRWRNWSLPWHDTSIDRYTADGKVQLDALLNGHISMTAAVILVPETAKTGDGRFWLNKQLELATKHSKPVIGVMPVSGDPFPESLASSTRTIVRRDAEEIVNAVRALTGMTT